MRSFVHQLRCLACDALEPVDASGVSPSGDGPCPRCGAVREVEFDYDAARSVLGPASLASDPRRTLLRYAPLLPIQTHGPTPPLAVGMTPIQEAPRLASALGIARAWLKNDALLPTGSLKDRASFVGVARAVSQKKRVIAAASTGNAGTSVAGMAASMGLDAHIFVPASAPEAKIAQLCVYGARLFLVNSSYDRAYDLCQEAVRRFGWYDRSAAVNPYLVEGKKTCGLEIAEQLGPDALPDWVAMSVGDGCSIAGVHKGLFEMKRLGMIDRVPRMLGVQASGAAALASAFHAGRDEVVRLEETHTIADSINVGMPRNGRKALRAVRASSGTFVEVEDSAILDWLPRVARTTGVFAEPTAIAAVAGIEVAARRGIIGPGESVLAVITGSGLKDVKTAMRTVRAPAPIEPRLEAVEEVLAREGDR